MGELQGSDPTNQEWKDNLRQQADTEIRLQAMSSAINALAVKIPDKLNETMIGVSMKLDGLIKDVEKVRKELESDYIGRTEFEILKVEHDQIKKLMWGFIAMVLTAVAGAVIALVLKG